MMDVNIWQGVSLKKVNPISYHREIFRILANPWIFEMLRFGLSREMSILETRAGSRFLVRPDTEDHMVLVEVMICHEYQRVLAKLKKRDVVVDVGANVGLFAVQAACASKKVYAYEPEEENCRMLRINVELNNLRNVFVFPIGLAKNSAKRKFYLRNSQAGRYTLYKPKEKSGVREVSCISLDQVYQQNKLERVDLLKIDCEGCEYEVLAGASKRSLSRTRAILMEYHLFNHTRQDLLEMIDRLKQNGFSVSLTKKRNGTGFIYARRRRR